MRRLALIPVLALLALSLLGTLPASAQEQPGGGSGVDVFEVHGVLESSQLGALKRAVTGAPARGVDVLLIQLDSFGGLGVSPAEVLDTVRRSPVPVAVWVGPRAGTAAGSAAMLVAGADVVAVAREAGIGPALPGELGRSRNAAAEQATVAGSGLPAAAVTGRLDGPGALAAGLADYEAESLPDAVGRLDGRSVDGRALSVRDAYDLTFLSRSLPDRVRHGLANPTLAYLLLLGAACCLAFEWFQPGFGVAGVAGVVLALLAVYAIAVLPTNWLALAALSAGLLVFTVDTALGGLGLGTVIATALTAAGSWWLFASPSPLLRTDPWLVLLGVVWCLVYWVVVLTMALKARRSAPEGTEALVGSRGIVRSMLNPGGIVVIEGAMWRARLDGGDGMLPTGQRVSVVSVAEGILQVAPDDPAAVRPAKGGRFRRAGRERVPVGNGRPANGAPAPEKVIDLDAPEPAPDPAGKKE
jgi:membrane-bound serine protease (ClpP class)